ELGRHAGRFGWFRGPPAGLPRRDWRETYDTEYRTGLGYGAGFGRVPRTWRRRFEGRGYGAELGRGYEFEFLLRRPARASQPPAVAGLARRVVVAGGADA
ncbi:MAG: hypothetical protein HY703_09230, partial [Gemmatimonadetes bacterium]|nr:hypothetical protein [Gemmatimonadota bacterium]